MSDGLDPSAEADGPAGDGSPGRTDGRPSSGTGSPSSRARLVGRSPLPPVRGRWPAALTVIGVVVAVAVIAAVVGTPGAAPAAPSFDGVPIPPVGAYSSSAFCSSGIGTVAADTIYLTNSTDQAVTGVMTTVGTGATGTPAPIRKRAIVVPADGSAAVNPSAGLPAGNNASTFVFSGGGVVASQVVSGPSGWSTAPCASRTSSQWSFAGGSTTAGDTLALTLFNPASTGAVVNVSFLTSSGKETPQPYQGLTVPPGQEVVENVGDFVQNASAVATFVTAQSGMLVSNEFQQWGSGPTGGVSLRLGAPDLSTTWRFAQTTVAPTGSVSFILANPSPNPVTASIAVGLSSGSVLPRQVVLPPLASTVFNASAATGLPRQVPFAAVVTAAVPIVVGRTVQAPSSAAPPPVWGGSSGTVTATDRWLVPAPGVPNAPGTSGATVASLAVANPGSAAARVSVTTVGGTRGTITFTVPGGSLAVLGPKQVGGLSPLLVTSSAPINLEEESGPTGAPGIVSSTGFPFAS